MPSTNGTIIRIGKVLTKAELKFVDSTTKDTLNWFINAALEADVNLEDTADISAFCRYLILSLTKTERLLVHLHNNDLNVLELQQQLYGKELD